MSLCDIEDSERVAECCSCGRMMPAHQIVICEYCASTFCIICAGLSEPDAIARCKNCRGF